MLLFLYINLKGGVMKKIVLTLISLLFLAPQFFPQEKDSLIQLYPGLGDTLDRFDRDYFGLFQWDKDFESARLFIRNDKQLISKVTYFENGFRKDTLFTQSLTSLAKVRSDIQLIDDENEKRINSAHEVIIFLKNGNHLKGTLDMFNKKYLYATTVPDLQPTNSSQLKIKVPASEVDSIILIGESKVLSSMGWGFLSGAVIGGLIGFASGDDESGFIKFSQEEKALGAGVAIGLVGVLIGLIAGIISSTDDETIKNDYQIDLLKFKEYAKYYFKYDESVEKYYILIE